MTKNMLCEVTVTLTFDHQILISSSLSPSGRLYQIWRNSFKVFLSYHVHKNGTGGQTADRRADMWVPVVLYQNVHKDTDTCHRLWGDVIWMANMTEHNHKTASVPGSILAFLTKSTWMHKCLWLAAWTSVRQFIGCLTLSSRLISWKSGLVLASRCSVCVRS